MLPLYETTKHTNTYISLFNSFFYIAHNLIPIIIYTLSKHYVFGFRHRIRDDFQYLLRPLVTLMFVNIIKSHSMKYELLLFVTHHMSNIWGLPKTSPSVSLLFTFAKLLHIHIDGCFETLIFCHVRSIKMFSFCDALHERKKNANKLLRVPSTDGNRL